MFPEEVQVVAKWRLQLLSKATQEKINRNRFLRIFLYLWQQRLTPIHICTHANHGKFKLNLHDSLKLR